MKALCTAGLASLAALGAQAQVANLPSSAAPMESLVVTATRSLEPATSMRDTVVITRAQIEDAGAISLGDLLQRQAGVELRATGGPGQPEDIFIRGAGAAQTLVLVDGVRVGSSTTGTTSIENIPLEMIERIEVVKGPLSSLYGSEAAGGVIQIFTRGRNVPHLFTALGYGSDKDRRASGGFSSSDANTVLSLAAGVRKVDAPSATNSRSPSYFPDRDPYENGFATLHGSYRAWTGELLAVDAFVSRGRTSFDSGPAPDGGNPGDRSDQTLSGVRLTSSAKFAEWWSSRIVLAEGRDKLEITGLYPSNFETRKDEASWVNELPMQDGLLLLGAEIVRENVLPDAASDPAQGYSKTERTTSSAFASLTRAYAGQRIEANARRDQEDQFGSRDTGSVSYGFDWPSFATLSLTWARGFRAPTFNDLYGPSYPGFYTPNPNLQPERSTSREASIASLAGGGLRWKLTAFDNQLEDLIQYSPEAQTVLNVASARVRGIEASLDGAWLGLRWHAIVTAQRPRDETTGSRLQGRAERFGTVGISRTFGSSWNAGLSVFASGDRYDSVDEAPASRLPGYAVVDARASYRIDKHWTAELTASNLADKRYEAAVGYDAPRRGVFLNVRFDAF
ncbi:MAG TPA: TonB-dependent receptor [Usitatibacter sp.]|nr:TonB-dependent receptor [Usitatibacter sp.]